MNEKNQMLKNMLCAAMERLSSHSAQEISENASVQLESETLLLNTFGQEIRVSFPDFDVSPTLPHWHLLTILHYLDLADGTPLSEIQMPFAHYRDGMVRGGGFDRDAEEIICKKLGKLPPDVLQKRCLALGGEIAPSNADLCIRFSFAPRYPVWLKMWFADDEFPASGRLFVSKSAEHYLTIEDAVTVGTILLDALTEDCSLEDSL